MARTQPIATLVTSLVIGAVCAVALATVGQTAAAEARVLAHIDDAGTRTIVVSDPGEAGLRADSMIAVRSLAGIAWLIGLGPVEDARNSALGPAGRLVPTRPLYGELPDIVRIVAGRLPSRGEGIAGNRAIGLLGAHAVAAGIRGDTVDAPIVGVFRAGEPLSFLDGTLLLPAAEESGSRPLRQIVVVAESVDDVDTLSRAIPLVLHADDRSRVRIQTPASLVELRGIVEAELSSNSRQLLLVVLGIGLVVVMVTQAGAVAQRRRDFGRRRALGATRSAVTVLVIVQTISSAFVGVVLGSVAGVVAILMSTGSPPPFDFVTALAILALLSAVLAAVPPGIGAAFRDPVRILRVP